MSAAARTLLGAALLAAAWPSAAATVDRECRAIRAVTNGDGRNFADLNFEAQRRARLALRVGRGAGVVANAETCETDVGEDSSDIACEWVFADYVAAAGFYDGLVDRLRLCLGQAVPKPKRTLRRRASRQRPPSAKCARTKPTSPLPAGRPSSSSA